MLNTFNETDLIMGENVVAEARPSKRALLITWLSVPTFIFIFIILPMLGPLFAAWFSVSVKHAIITSNDSSFSYAWGQVFGALNGFLKFLIFFPIVVISIIWAIFCLVLTYRHFQYNIIVTEKKLIGKSGDRDVSVLLKRIKNVYVEQSLWGRLLNYGNIMVNMTTETLEFKSISNPEKIKRILNQYASDYCAH